MTEPGPRQLVNWTLCIWMLRDLAGVTLVGIWGLWGAMPWKKRVLADHKSGMLSECLLRIRLASSRRQCRVWNLLSHQPLDLRSALGCANDMHVRIRSYLPRRKCNQRASDRAPNDNMHTCFFIAFRCRWTCQMANYRDALQYLLRSNFIPTPHHI